MSALAISSIGIKITCLILAVDCALFGHRGGLPHGVAVRVITDVEAPKASHANTRIRRHQLSVAPPQAPCLPLRGSVRNLNQHPQYEYQIDPQIKAGDMFTAASISLSAVAPLVFLAKDRANRVADQTNKASQDRKNYIMNTVLGRSFQPQWQERGKPPNRSICSNTGSRTTRSGLETLFPTHSTLSQHGSACHL
jgi:hypothetical protein